jgi:hypothetical protein
MKNRGLLSICIVILLILISITGCIFENRDDNKSNDYTYKYSIAFNCFNETNFTLLVPLPIWSNNSVSNVIISKLKVIDGNVDWSINDSIKGIAIKIKSNTNLKMESNGVSNKYPYETLSMKKDSNIREYWIYFESGNNLNCTIEINCYSHREKYSETTISKLSGRLINGWNIVNGVHSHSID